MSARARLWLLFGLLAVVSAAILAGAGWLADRGDLPAWLCWAGAAFLIVALQAGLWDVLDRRWLQPSVALAREIELLIHANAEHRITPPADHGLGPLPAAVAALAERWRTSAARSAATSS